MLWWFIYRRIELKVECVRKNITLEKLASQIGIDNSTLYRKIKGQSDFSRNELQMIREILSLDNDKFLSIFFNK